MIRTAFLSLLLLPSILVHAEPVPAAVIDSCLLFTRSSDPSIAISPIEGDGLMDDVTVPGYRRFLPGIERNMQIGYAASKHGSNDYIFVGARRGYIVRAVAVGTHQPSRIEEPSLAAYAVLHQRGQRFVCVMESNGNGSAAFVRSVYVGRIPCRPKSAELKLYYKVADVKRFRGFEEAMNLRP